MLKSGGENGTSFLNSRKVKSVLSAFYFWKMASKFQEIGDIPDFVPRILIPSDENYFPSLAISFSSDGNFISSDVFSITSRDFFTKVRSFPLKEGKSR